MMRYGADSPVFNALELAGNALTRGKFAPGGDSGSFCIGCHAPIAVSRSEVPPFPSDAEAARPSRDYLSPIGHEGISCDYCHQIPHANPTRLEVGNVSLSLVPSSKRYGPIEDPVGTSFHTPQGNSFLTSSEFCGACHSVRFPRPDLVRNEDHLHVDTTYSEWLASIYAVEDNPWNEVISCQDCHMSSYPYEPPGTYPRSTVVVPNVGAFDPPVRRVSTHYFTGADVALIEYPGQDGNDLDEHEMPSGQVQRRRDLLRAACELSLDSTPSSIIAGQTLPLRISVENVGAGHNVPTGLSQERQMWLEVELRDDTGDLLYRSGYLEDRAHPETGELEPDGRLNDEDLLDHIAMLDPETLEVITHENGPDHDQRPEINLGLRSYNNRFYRLAADGSLEQVYVFFLADHTESDRSLAPFVPVIEKYDIPVPPGAVGPLHARVRLRFRAFPPKLLRVLARRYPNLVDEQLVDRNEIVDMAEVETTIELQ